MWAAVSKKHNSGKSLRQKYSITGLVAHLLALGERIQEDVKRSAQNFRTQHLKEAEELPQLKRIPLPVQKLIVEELDALRHTIVIVSTNTMYRATVFSSGIYEGRGQESALEGDRGDIGAPARRALTLKETLERLRSRYYELEEGIDPEQRENTMNLWFGFLQRASADFPTEEGTTYIINVEREQREAGGEE
ncbi:hypothetical protein V1504DRAFT_469593 [Lipomyces starkeyi]